MRGKRGRKRLGKKREVSFETGNLGRRRRRRKKTTFSNCQFSDSFRSPMTPDVSLVARRGAKAANEKAVEEALKG
jgi:hypothetical protein